MTALLESSNAVSRTLVSPRFRLLSLVSAVVGLGLILALVVSAPARQRRIDRLRANIGLPAASDDLVAYAAIHNRFPMMFAQLGDYRYLDKHFYINPNALPYASGDAPLVVVKLDSVWILDDPVTASELANLNANCLQFAKKMSTR